MIYLFNRNFRVSFLFIGNIKIISISLEIIIKVFIQKKKKDLKKKSIQIIALILFQS